MKSFEADVGLTLGLASGKLIKDVIRIRDELSSASLTEAARCMMDAKDLAARIGAIKAELEKLHDTLRFGIIPDLMTDAGATSTTLEGIGRVTVMDDVQCTVPADSKAAFQEWLIDQGFEDMISQSVNAQTLAAFVRRRIKEGKELPIELLKVKPITRASITAL